MRAKQLRQYGARDVADVVLASVFDLRASILRLAPVDSERREHELTALRDGVPLATTTVCSETASAVVLRLAAIAGIDPSQPAGRVGRCEVVYGDDTAELVVCCHSTPLGLSADVMAVSSAAYSAPQLPARLAPGTEIGPYVVQKLIGAGGMGLVYRAEHRMLRKPFALKILRSELLAESPHFSEWFLREARAAAQVRSSWVVDVSDFGVLPDGRPYLAMELLSGSSLESILRGEGAMPHSRAVDFALRIARALEATHAAGVVHRDLSTNNVVVENDAVKLVDFGAAMVVDSDDLQDEGDRVLGTPHYMAPERARDGSADQRTDLYALGVMLYEMFTGDPPFYGDDVIEIVRGHLRKPVPNPDSPYGELPPMAHEVLGRLLAKKPDDRYPNATVARAALEQLSRVVRDREELDRD